MVHLEKIAAARSAVLLPAAGIIVLDGIKDRGEVNGPELANQLNGLRPNLKHLYMSGCTADVIAHHSQKAPRGRYRAKRTWKRRSVHYLHPKGRCRT